ncbi:hypothetical protein [Oceanibium sediminis]|uniref:hypothetical protein n=1 Tax=Oceanibium sediminis TaxID=2026339 RepID=UPI0013004CF3|nr:hypothetical protein [Oceanibium sediminis]
MPEHEITAQIEISHFFAERRYPDKRGRSRHLGLRIVPGDRKQARRRCVLRDSGFGGGDKLRERGKQSDDRNRDRPQNEMIQFSPL